MRRPLVFLFIVIVALSCGRSNVLDPGLAPQDRDAQAFADPVQLFGAPPQQPCYDADVCTIVNGPWTGVPGTEWEDAEGNRWSVACALQRNADNTVTGVMRILGEGTGAQNLGPVTTFGYPGGQMGFPRVAACYFFDWEYPDYRNFTFVEVSLVYQWLNDTTGLTDIVIQRLWYDPADFSQGNIQNIQPFGSTWQWFDSLKRCIHPDVAYDPTNGNIFIVFTQYDNPFVAYVYHRVGWRRYPFMWVEPWYGPWIAQKTGVLNDEHNGFNPRIDIGRVAVVSPFTDQNWMVGIAYTGSSNDPNVGIHVRINYWLAASYGAHPDNDTWIPDPDQNYQHSAGVPSIDIGPPGTNFAAIVYNQAKSESWSNVTVTYRDNRGGLARFTPIENPEDEWSAFPSVAIHNHTSGDFLASVSYLYKGPLTQDWWNPRARSVDTATNLSGFATGTYLGPQMLVTDQVHGQWDSGHLFDHYWGMNTALVVYDNNLTQNYWMLWSSILTGQPSTPQQVHGTYGYTE